MSIPIRCDCGKQYRVSEEHLGKSGKCTACGATLPIVRKDASSSAEETEPTTRSRGDAASPAEASSRLCPACNKPMEPGAGLCNVCRQQAETAPAAAVPPRPAEIEGRKKKPARQWSAIRRPLGILLYCPLAICLAQVVVVVSCSVVLFLASMRASSESRTQAFLIVAILASGLAYAVLLGADKLIACVVVAGYSLVLGYLLVRWPSAGAVILAGVLGISLGVGVAASLTWTISVCYMCFTTPRESGARRFAVASLACQVLAGVLLAAGALAIVQGRNAATSPAPSSLSSNAPAPLPCELSIKRALGSSFVVGCSSLGQCLTAAALALLVVYLRQVTRVFQDEKTCEYTGEFLRFFAGVAALSLLANLSLLVLPITLSVLAAMVFLVCAVISYVWSSRIIGRVHRLLLRSG
jgi:hypothetical protein